MANGHGGARPNTGRRKTKLPVELTNTALEKLTELVERGDKDAVKMVLDRSIPVLKAVSNGIDAKLVEAKIHEITVLARRVEQLEALLNAPEEPEDDE